MYVIGDFVEKIGFALIFLGALVIFLRPAASGRRELPSTQRTQALPKGHERRLD